MKFEIVKPHGKILWMASQSSTLMNLLGKASIDAFVKDA